MEVKLIPCGPFANESEQIAAKFLQDRLRNYEGPGPWLLLTGVLFSVNTRRLAEEIDLVAIGPPGVTVIEIKHWDDRWMERNPWAVEHAAGLVATKAKKVGTTLRRHIPNLPFVVPAILLTKSSSQTKNSAGNPVRGVPRWNLQHWKEVLRVQESAVLTPSQIDNIARILCPRVGVVIDGTLRTLGEYTNLELCTPREERFHRVYRGIHVTRRDKVVLHLFDLSAREDAKAMERARREFEALQRLQLFPWAPRVLDSFREAPGYPGELYFFTIADPLAPTLAERSRDMEWKATQRIRLALSAVEALEQLHACGKEEPFLHRCLSPETILVQHDDTVVFTGFHLARLPDHVTVASGSVPPEVLPTAAPEVQAQGLAAADRRSDVYSLCTSLVMALEGLEDPLADRAVECLKLGMQEAPEDRSELSEIRRCLATLLEGEPKQETPALPDPRFWTEGLEISWEDCRYRIVCRIGSGGIGTTFKLVQLLDNQDGPTCVGKIVTDSEYGPRVRESYGRVCRLEKHPNLARVHAVASRWSSNQFVAVMDWVEGTPLREFQGMFELLAEELGESIQSLALHWLDQVCRGLQVLHGAELVHGDISPGNLLVCGDRLILTDFDLVAQEGSPRWSQGTVEYMPEGGHEEPMRRADDLFSLAASFFHVITGRTPFLRDGQRNCQAGLNWPQEARQQWPVLVEFLDRLTAPKAATGPQSAGEALQLLRQLQHKQSESQETSGEEPPQQPPISSAKPQEAPQEIPRLRLLLQAYPGSLLGNTETRGLDSEFARTTYVATPLEKALLEQVQKREVRLVILCGNAGDGKTALLQHLSQQLGLGSHHSRSRIIQGTLADGTRVVINLDGSAAYQDRSADELLDEFFEPFRKQTSPPDRVHLVAINDGRLLEWIEHARHNWGECWLTCTLQRLVLDGTDQIEHVRLIDLNKRSLVGGVNQQAKKIDTQFLDALVDRLYGGEQTESIWAPCRVCTARHHCAVYEAGRWFAPQGFPEQEDAARRRRARDRLYEALQAVHLVGRVHITMRELRSALIYILFGTHYCRDYHGNADLEPFWDRAFDPQTPNRQGEVLQELARLDPALDSHPFLDRYLTSSPLQGEPSVPCRYPELSLASARRRAFFQWSASELEQVTGHQDALCLYEGERLALFRRVPLMDSNEREWLCHELCRGIASLEILPPVAYDLARGQNALPLRVPQRTPTETQFWIHKPLERFRLEAVLPSQQPGVDRLHRRLRLVYTYRDHTEEHLELGLDLFHLLLLLAGGYQLGDISSDDVFTQLHIFTQRLLREDERVLWAWNPTRDETVFRVFIQHDKQHHVRQRIAIETVNVSGQGVQS